MPHGGGESRQKDIILSNEQARGEKDELLRCVNGTLWMTSDGGDGKVSPLFA